MQRGFSLKNVINCNVKEEKKHSLRLQVRASSPLKTLFRTDSRLPTTFGWLVKNIHMGKKEVQDSPQRKGKLAVFSG